MNNADMAQAAAVVCFVFSAVCGYFSARRARSFNVPWQWPGVLSLIVLACIAWPAAADSDAAIVRRVPSSVSRPDPFVGILISTLQRFEKIQSERKQHAIAEH